MADLARIRTDVVGSLLRPDYLKEAYHQHGRAELDDDGLRAVQDRAIREAVALQEAVGLDVLTDGEFRRLNFQDSFGAGVVGYDEGGRDIEFHETRVQGGQPLSRFDFHATEAAGPPVVQRRPVVERLRLARNLPRAVSRDLGVRLRVGSWPLPALFDAIASAAEMDGAEIRATFNCGIGFAAIVEPAATSDAIQLLAESGIDAWQIGEVVTVEDLGGLRYVEA